ncbi:tudor domain-containing protein 1 isoform X2 [Pleurodeles waltl]
MENNFSGNVLRMNLPFPGNQKREKGIPHESLRSPRTYPNFSSRSEVAGASIGLLNKNFYLCEQTKQYFSNTESKSRDCSPKDSGKVTNGGKECQVVSKMNKGPLLGKSLENVKGESLRDDATALHSNPGHAAIIKEAKLLSNSENLFSVSCDPKMFALPSRSTTCHYCGLHGSRRCGQCKQAFYCSETCQKKDWATHSNVCKPIKNKTEDPSKLTAEAGGHQNLKKESPSLLSDHRIESESRKRIMLTDLQSIDLKKGTEIQGTVLGFKSPSDFFVQIYSAEVAEHLSNVSLTLKSMYNSVTASEGYNPVKGEVCVAKYSVDQCWCRVVVRDVDIALKKSQLLFIDFGNEEEASLDSIYPLHINVGLHPPAAIQCAVADVVPVQEVWTQECNSTIGQQLLGQYCTCKVVDMQRGTERWTMDVMITSIGKSLGDLLVEKGYGCKQIDLKNDTSKTAPLLEPSCVNNREKPDARKIRTLLPDNVPSVKLISLSVGDIFPAAVTEVQTPEDFFCQQLQDARKLAELQAALSAHYTTAPSCENFSTSVGDFCCAQFTEDNQWYRASVIRSISKDSVLVGYVDYGNFEILPVSRLRPILPVFQELRWQAIKCSLAGVKPPKGTWTSKAISAMKEKVANKIITVKVVKKIESTSLVELIDETSNPVVNIAAYLLETGHASYTDGECQTTVLDNHTSEVVKQKCAQVAKKDWIWAELTLNKQTEVTVCLLYNPGEFYCQIYREEDLYALNKMNKMLAEHCQTVPNNISNLAKDDVCCAFFSGDGHWYRGLVKEVIEGKKAKVHFVDYGNVETVDMDKLRAILPKFLKLPFQGIRCWLSDIKPVNKHWTSEATAKLQMCVSGIKLQALPLCITEDGVGVELIDCSQDPPQIISHVLVSQHLALKNTNKAGGLRMRESTVVYEKTQQTVLSDKCDMPSLIEQLNNIDQLTKADLHSHFDSTQMSQQGVQFDKMPGRGQDKYHIIPTSEQTGKGTEANMPPAGQMPEQRELSSNSDTRSRKGSDNGSYMPPNKKQHNTLAMELLSASKVDELPTEEVAHKINFDDKNDVSEKCSTYYWHSIELPINEATLVYVLKVENPSMFYVQLKDNRVDKEKLQWTMIELAEYCSSQKNQNYTPNIGDVCCARYTGNNHWYRAIVLELFGSTVKVAYVDYGIVENLQFSRLLPIKASLLELPLQIIQCSLEGLIPHTAEWSLSAVERFKSLVLDKDVTIKVLRVCDDIHRVTMEMQDHQGMINIADYLVREGLALRSKLVNENFSVTGEMGICCCKELKEQLNRIQETVAALELKVDHITRRLEKNESSRKKYIFEE